MFYLSENLKKFRVQKNLTQEDVAAYAGEPRGDPALDFTGAEYGGDRREYQKDPSRELMAKFGNARGILVLNKKKRKTSRRRSFLFVYGRVRAVTPPPRIGSGAA